MSDGEEDQYSKFKKNLHYLETNELQKTSTNIDLLVSDPSVNRIKQTIQQKLAKQPKESEISFESIALVQPAKKAELQKELSMLS